MAKKTFKISFKHCILIRNDGTILPKFHIGFSNWRYFSCHNLLEQHGKPQQLRLIKVVSNHFFLEKYLE